MKRKKKIVLLEERNVYKHLVTCWTCWACCPCPPPVFERIEK